MSPLPRLDDAQQLSEVAAKIEASEPITALEARTFAGGGSPLGGAKPKALIDIDGEQWIIKFFNNEPVDTPLIEHATMTLARRAGITVAETRVIRLTGANAIAVRRFDREQGRHHPGRHEPDGRTRALPSHGLQHPGRQTPGRDTRS